MKHSLKHIYTETFKEEQTERVARFFTHLLGVPDASLDDLIEELAVMARDGDQDFDRIVDLYKRIAKIVTDDEAKQPHVR